LRRVGSATDDRGDAGRAERVYAALGWQENDGSDNTYTSYTLGVTRLALYPSDQLGAEAAPGAQVVRPGTWNGVTLALNVATRAEVDRVLGSATDAGATPVASPMERDWGGYSGYFADPEGNRWEVVWAPGFMEPA
jgi:hypothetical protein